MPSTPIITRRYYPTLSTIINLDDIPDSLGFIKSGIVALFDKIHFKDLQYSKSPRGDGAFYSLSIVSPKKIAIEIPGTGINLVLNPDISDVNISAFPITLEYEWKVLGYLRDLDLENFSFSAQEIFEAALMVLNISQEDALAQFVDLFVVPVNSTTTPLEQFVTDLNDGYGGSWTTLIPAPTSETKLSEIANHIYQESGEFATLAAFGVYLLTADASETMDKVKEYFKSLLPEDIETYITDIVTPKFGATLTLSAGIEFPRSILKPVYSGTGENPFDGTTGHIPYEVIPPINPSDPENPNAPYALLTVGEAIFHVNTTEGIGYNAELSLNTVSPVQIGNTPLILSITNAKIDLSDRTNIREANEDGRPASFKGVFIEEATIGLRLDNDKFPDAAAVSLYTKNLLVGSEGGISGTIGIKADTITHPQHWSSLILDTTPNISYDFVKEELTIRGDKETAAGLVEDTPEGTVKPEVVAMPSGDILDIRDAKNNYYRVTRTGNTIGVAPSTGISLSPLSLKFGGSGGDANVLTLNTFSVTFHQNDLVDSDISGTLYMPKVNGGTTIDIDVDISNGFHVKFKSTPALQITDNSIFGLTLDFLQIHDTEDFFQIALGDTVAPELGGTLTNNIDIPFANKFVPRTFQFDYLAWKKYKTGYAGSMDDQGFNYSLLFTWDNGLSLPISNLGTAISPFEFRKKFEISKKKEEGFFKLDSIDLVIKPEVPDGMSAALELYGAQFNLGKAISFTIDGLGLKTTFIEADSGNSGDIGPFDVNFDITGPKGIGVSIDAGAVKGTGYLYIDDSEYRGLVQLEISGKFTITAIAILNTKMPDGSKGNSFITIISITGLNIQLGMGFVLDGLGGILGIHRTMDTQFLRDGIREGTLDSLMFPQNVQENLSKIISDMKSVYPMKRDQFIFGPMARLFWGGVKSIVVADLALLIEFSDPTRLIVLGKAVIGIIVGNFDLILIQVGVLAELNFTEKKLMIDASIYNSTLVFFNLEGDMALRLYWGDEKAFLLTVGGFHPDYKPSENMKVNNVRRMKISLLNDNPRLTIEAYFAVTSNTVQFGSKVDFYFGIKGFSVKGGFGFDCLFQFNPFQFTVGVYAYLGVYKGSSELMGISLNGTLKGTTPWSINGSVKFKVLFIKVKGRVDKTWGDRKNTELPAVKVHELVTTAFEDDKNWTSFFPAQRYFLVGLNDNSKVAEDDLGNPALLMNPTSTLTVKQDVVPLGVKLNHYYNQKVDGSDTFSITNIELGSDTYADGQLTKTKTEFAPAQYFNYSDKDKLKKSSFETMVNGVSLTGSGNLSAQHVLDMPYNYDITLYDGKPEDDPEWLSFDKLTSALAHDFMAVDELVKGGMISNHPQSRSNRFLSEKVEGNVVNSSDEFVIVNKNTFEAHDGDISTWSASDLSSANDLMNQVMIGDPDLEGELMVVQKYEMI